MLRCKQNLLHPQEVQQILYLKHEICYNPKKGAICLSVLFGHPIYEGARRTQHITTKKLGSGRQIGLKSVEVVSKLNERLGRNFHNESF